MNWLDILLAVILLFSFAGALWNGITREVVRIIALLGGIFGGMWWYTDLTPHITPYVRDESMASFAAFGVIVVGSLVAGGVIAWLLAKVLHWSGLRWFDRLLGGAFGLVRGLILATAIVLAVVHRSAGPPQRPLDCRPRSPEPAHLVLLRFRSRPQHLDGTRPDLRDKD